jgi:hypothetical protein
MKLLNKIFYKITILISFLFVGIIIGFLIHREQPPFLTKIKEILILSAPTKLINNKARLTQLKKKIVMANFWSENILDKVEQEKFINNDKFINFFKLVSKKTFENYSNNSQNFKNNFLYENILDEIQVKFEKVEKEVEENFKKYYLPTDYENENYEIYQIKYYENYNFGILHKSNNLNKKLIIYNQGHDGNSYQFDYFLDLKLKYLDDGYDILNLNMPLRGFNLLQNKYMSFPVNPYKKILPSESIDYPFLATREHNVFKYFYDKDFPQKKPLSLFLSGNYYLIKKILLLNNYSEVKIIGHSGGGLMSIYNMFLIPDIKKSYISSGFFPKIYRLDDTGGDWEHHYSDFILNNTYFDLIYGSLIDQNNKFSREIVFQFNNKDPSCCGAPYSRSFVTLFNENSKELNLNIKSFFINKNTHRLDLDTLYNNF